MRGLINDSLFPMSTDAQFVIRISAVEALCGQDSRDTSVCNLAQQLIARLTELSGADDAKETIRRQLIYVQKQSIRAAYMAQFRSLLGDAKARDFDALYKIRSSFVHEGKGRGALTRPAS